MDRMEREKEREEEGTGIWKSVKEGGVRDEGGKWVGMSQ